MNYAVHKKSYARGFTLTEVMVVLVIALIGMSGILTMFSQSARSVDVLDQHLAAQRQLRFATEAVKRDLRLAGFLSTPNGLVDANQCPNPATSPGVYPLRAVSIQRGNGFIHEPSVNANLVPSSLTLLGDFSGGQLFESEQIDPGTDSVVLRDTDSTPKTKEEWDLVFTSNRILRVTNSEQYDFYLPIKRTDFPARTIYLDGSIPVATPPDNCGVLGFGGGYSVNVNYYIRYRIMDDPRERSQTILIREELEADGQTAVPSTRMIIGENVIDLNFYDFIFDVGTAAVPELKRAATMTELIDGNIVVDAAGGGLLGVSGANHPENLRAITVKLTACGREQNVDTFFQPRQDPTKPIYVFKIDKTMAGAVRCMSAASRVQLRSLMVRNLKQGD